MKPPNSTTQTLAVSAQDSLSAVPQRRTADAVGAGTAVGHEGVKVNEIFAGQTVRIDGANVDVTF